MGNDDSSEEEEECEEPFGSGERRANVDDPKQIIVGQATDDGGVVDAFIGRTVRKLFDRNHAACVISVPAVARRESGVSSGIDITHSS